ncbi:TonB-dependent receptor [Aquimarina sp. RZ0]|uniref:SusC/RagA family TonB-linked outer membrane protein n=1 Tax=Aquimarina sp. RZ0 TaxID=2607730 RepID=UPI0011F2363C|nr:TonB-dependent receptor [Aquimarina sp. RZ0]KAA1243393.1 TonB-dependent receptor [Aquimarina sp. RZ0]
MKKKYRLKNHFKTKLIALILLFGSGFAYAQTKTISGIVTGEDNTPLLGVNVQVKGKSVGTVTDFDGNYEIKASSNDVLVFTYIGFIKKEVAIKDKTKLDIFLSPDVASLDEVVVIGYGSVRRKDLTGSVVSVKAEELDRVKAVTFEGSLAAKASGVQVTQSEGGPGAGFKIRIRGGTSITASSEPLYVIDGFPISGEGVGSSVGLGNSTTSPLNTLDPSIIESIEVLKDASATAIYGSRGANGVILITTKKGKKGRANMNYETYTSFGVLARRVDVLSPQEFIDYRNEFAPWDPDDDTNPFIRSFRDQFGNDLGANDPNVIITDWQDEITRLAITESHKLSMNGGSDKTAYSGSFSYLNQEGIIRNTKFERYTGNLRLDQDVTDRIKTGISVNVGYNIRDGVVSAANENANGRAGIITNTLLYGPAQGNIDLEREEVEIDENGLLLSVRGSDIVNPLRNLQENVNRGNNFQTFGNVYLQYRVADGLTFKSSLRINAFANKGQAYFTEKFGWGRTQGGIAFVNTAQGGGITTEQNLNYNKAFGKHRVNVTAVYEQQQGTFESTGQDSRGFEIPGVNLDNLGTALVTNPNRSSFSKTTLQSWLTRAQYDYSDRYVINFSARYDGSSKFAEKWGFFPSVGIAWKVSNEAFLKDSNLISNLKLRGSFGETGNNGIPPFTSLSGTVLASTIFGGNILTTGAAIRNLQNPDFTWETTTQLDGGLSLGLFNNRISIEADYYNKETTDLILRRPLPATSGFTDVLENVGSLVNKGFEFSINTVNIQTKNFSWTSNFNISFNKNEVTDLGGADEFFVRALGDNQITDDYVVRVGESLGSIYGLESDGLYNYSDFVEFDGLTDAEAAERLFQDSADKGVYYDLLDTVDNGDGTFGTYTLKEGVTAGNQVDRGQYRPGMPKFVDQNGDGVINSDDRTIIGRTVPKHFGGFTNNFSYKNFDLSILTQWSYGNDIYNKNRVRGGETVIPQFNKLGYVRDRWTPTNPNTDIPDVRGYIDAGLGSNAFSSFVEDGSYLRINNITMGYSLPKDVIKTFRLKNFRIYGSVDNVYVFTKYSGFDPDVSVGNNQLTPGLDSDAYPRSRIFRIGVNVGF